MIFIIVEHDDAGARSPNIESRAAVGKEAFATGGLTA
jgi:hypothetical protein